MIHHAYPDGGRQNYFGLYPAIVTSLVDSESLGRIEVRFPWLGTDGDNDVRAWATLLSPYADADQGLQMLPEKDSQVIVAFEAGDLRRPYIVGSCWNGQESQPEQPAEANNIRTLKTRSGHELKFDDTSGATKITLQTSGGHTLDLDDGGSEIKLSHSSGSSIVFRSSGTIEINANAGVDINAPVFNVHSGTTTCDGMVSCTTALMSAACSSPTYTPGAGNVW